MGALVHLNGTVRQDTNSIQDANIDLLHCGNSPRTSSKSVFHIHDRPGPIAPHNDKDSKRHRRVRNSYHKLQTPYRSQSIQNARRDISGQVLRCNRHGVPLHIRSTAYRAGESSLSRKEQLAC